GQENVVGGRSGEAGLCKDQANGGKAEADDGEDAEGSSVAALMQGHGQAADHDADTGAQDYVIPKALAGGEPLTLAGTGVMTGEASLTKHQAGDDGQNEHGDTGQVGGG